MSLAEEIETLTLEQQERVRELVVVLKEQARAQMSPEELARREEVLKAALDPYRIDMSEFKFNREEANARNVFP